MLNLWKKGFGIGYIHICRPRFFKPSIIFMYAQNSDNALKDYDMITFGLLFK